MMRRLITLSLLSCACTFVRAQDIDIITIAGKDTGSYSGDGGVALDCTLNGPESVSLDRRGNLYFSDLFNGRIRKINLSTGIVTTVAGNGNVGNTGNNGPATDADLSAPTDVFADMAGNLFIATPGSNTIHKVTISTGIITTIAGNGTVGSSGDGGLATNAELNTADGVCVDRIGNIYIADYYNNKIRKVDAATKIITTIAGTGTQGYTGDNSPATNAEFYWPDYITLDSIGNIYISDQFNHAVRKVDATTGIITTIAGNGTAGYTGNGGLAIHAQLNQPGGLYMDKQNNLYFAEYGNGVIRRIDGATGIISTVAGNGVCGFSGDGGLAIDAQIIPFGVTLDTNGVMYIADYQNNRIRMVYNTLAVKPVAVNKEISIYPNPANDNLIIENAANNTVYIYDVVGKEVYKTAIKSDKETVNLSGFANGVYVVQTVDMANMSRVTKKVVKE